MSEESPKDGGRIAEASGTAVGSATVAGDGQALAVPAPDNPASIGIRTQEAESKAVRRYLIGMGLDAKRLDAAIDRAKAIQQMSKMSDREVGILLAAFVEAQLDLLIRGQFIDTTKEHTDMVNTFMRGRGALAAFSAKIDFAWILGFYTVNVWEHLHRIRKIRNAFAHDVPAHSFDVAPMNDLVPGLTIADGAVSQTGPDEWEITYPASKAGISYREKRNYNPLSGSRRERYSLACTYLFNALAGQVDKRPIPPPPF